MVAKTEKTLEDLFHDMLKDIYFAEGRSSRRCRKWPGAPTRQS